MEKNKKIKVIKINEADIERMVNRIVKEDLPRRELQRKQSMFKKSEFDPYKREKQIQGMFGSYAEDIPANVIQYLRKNPQLVFKRLLDIYGDKAYEYLDIAAEMGNAKQYRLFDEGDDYISEEELFSEKENEWPEDLEKGRFTEYCKREGFSGANKACAEHAFQSDDKSVRGMASFYLNTVKP